MYAHVTRHLLLSAAFSLTLLVFISAELPHSAPSLTTTLSGTHLLLTAPLVWISPHAQRDFGLMGGLATLQLPWIALPEQADVLLPLCAAGYLILLFGWIGSVAFRAAPAAGGSAQAEVKPDSPETKPDPPPEPVGTGLLAAERLRQITRRDR